MVDLRLIFFGTSSAIPTDKRNLSSLTIIRNGELFIFDVGEGMQKSFLKSKIGINKSTRIFITHLHGDHCLGLLGLLQTMSLSGRTKPIFIYGPHGIIRFINNNIDNLILKLNYNILINEVDKGIVIEEEEYIIKTCNSYHSINSKSYLFEEKERPGIFDPEKALKLEIPKGKLWSLLQKGEEIKINGNIIESKQVVTNKRNGRKIGISGDTRPNKKLIDFFKGSDVLIFDSTYGDENTINAKNNKHSTSREAATIASQAKVKLLILTHFSSRYKNVDILVNQAKEVHKNVIAAYDLMNIKVLYDK